VKHGISATYGWGWCCGAPWGWTSCSRRSCPTAAILVLARFCRPSSERQIEQAWYCGTALPELLGASREQVHLQRLYRTLDALDGAKEAVEKHLKNRLGELFSIDHDLLLCDVTSTYFEGEASKNPQARYGYSRDKRFDCKQICIGLVVTTDGLPLGYEIFDGNRADVTTVEEIVEGREPAIMLLTGRFRIGGGSPGTDHPSFSVPYAFYC